MSKVTDLHEEWSRDPASSPSTPPAPPLSTSLARKPESGDNAPMLRPASFTDAHRRHWEDAELLFARDRWANADHLYGLSAECGLKAIMLGLGMDVDAEGKPREQGHKLHMPGLLPIFEAFTRKRDGGKTLALFSDGTPFDNWSIDDRYAHRRHFQSANVVPHRAAACRVGQFVQRAKQDGVL